jgi:hypothetical protein
MTRRISVLPALAGAVLVLAAPAWGDNWGADRQAVAPRVSPDLADRAAAASQSRMLDARERALGAANESVLASDFYADGFAEAVASRESRPEPVRDDRFRIGPTNAPVLVTPSPGTDLEWPQIGIGAGLGLLAAIGLLLALRTTRDRRLAH